MSRRLVFLFLAGLTLASAHAGFLPADAAKLTSLVPPPPADSSPAGLADLEIMLQVQADRTPAQVARAKRVDPQTPFTFAQPVLGSWFQAKDLPKTAAIFDQINKEAYHVIDLSKAHWNRPRPYVRDSAINVVVKRPGNASYPSGHSAIAAVWAAVLGAAFPEDASLFQKQVHEVMWSRVLGGVHFPSDTTAGKILGDAISRDLLASPEMKKALETIRAEAAPFRLKKAA